MYHGDGFYSSNITICSLYLEETQSARGRMDAASLEEAVGGGMAGRTSGNRKGVRN